MVGCAGESPAGSLAGEWTLTWLRKRSLLAQNDSHQFCGFDERIRHTGLALQSGDSEQNHGVAVAVRLRFDV